MLLLTDFANVLSVSVGLHLVYGFFPDIHKYFQTKEQRFMDHVSLLGKTIQENSLRDQIKTYQSLLEIERVTSIENNEKQQRIVMTISFLISIIATALLVFMGFNPKVSISYSVAILIVVISLLPMPIMVLFSYYSERKFLNKHKKNWDGFLNILKPYVEEQTKKALNDFFKSNEANSVVAKSRAAD